MKKSPRQELGFYANSGALRGMLEMHSRITPEARQLLIDIVMRYCEPKRRRKQP